MLVGLCALGLAVGATASLKEAPAARPLSDVVALNVDPRAPDILVDTRSLANLPAALLRAPLLKALLTEEFAFYYRDHATRLDVAGSLKRIAFEQDLSLPDQFLATLLDEPAELAIWRAEGGRPGHWQLNLRRNGLARLTEFLVGASLDDRQLSHVADLKDATRSQAIHALRLNNRETLLVVSRGERLLVASHPGLWLAANGQVSDAAKAALWAMLDAGADTPSPQARHFDAGKSDAAHRLFLAADLLGFGYGRFLPGLAALRFEHDAGVWRGAARVDGGAAPNLAGVPWAALPYDAAFCANLPLARAELAGLATALGAEKDALGGFAGAAAACWYAQDGWQAPLFAARFGDAQAAEMAVPAMAKLFETWIGAVEFGQAKGRFAVRAETGKHAAKVWRRQVSARYGDHDVPAGDTAAYSAARYFDVSLALRGDTLLFSPSARLVDRGLAVLGREYPAVAEKLPGGAPVLAVLDPARLGELLKRATENALDPAREPDLRRASERLLLPRYAALGKLAPMAARLSGDPPEKGAAWLALDWQDLK
jgi:uncharacterized protein YfaA (DUF2138 family)